MRKYLEEEVMKFFKPILIGAASFIIALMSSSMASAVVSPFHWDLLVRPGLVPDSCNWQAFSVECRLVNNTNQDLAVNQTFVEMYFQAGLTDITAVHPTGSNANIFNANGGFV